MNIFLMISSLKHLWLRLVLWGFLKVFPSCAVGIIFQIPIKFLKDFLNSCHYWTFFNPFLHSLFFHLETSHCLISSENVLFQRSYWFPSPRAIITKKGFWFQSCQIILLALWKGHFTEKYLASLKEILLDQSFWSNYHTTSTLDDICLSMD